MGRVAQPYCKYGHLKSGENLLLRPRSITVTRKYGSKVYKYPTQYTERVCVECLRRQRQDYEERQARKKSGFDEKSIEKQLQKSIYKNPELLTPGGKKQ